MRISTRLLLAALGTLALGLGSGSALAGGGQWGIGGFAGYQLYAMSDINDAISSANDDLAVNGYSERLDDIKGGVGFGGGVRYRMPTGWAFGVDYERLTANSDVSFVDGTLKMDASGNAVTGTLNYQFPSASRTRFGLAAGGGYYWSSGTISAIDASTLASVELDMSGSGVGFHGGGTADISLSSTAHLEVLAGYRYAKANDIEVAGVSTSDEIDWSGLITRVGFALYFGGE